MATRPNIVLILTDQHRLSAVGAYGRTVCSTPHLDRLAQEGIVFENAYTTCPLCSPARGTIITGQFPHSHGICTNTGNLGCSVNELRDGPGLLSRRLQSAGYSTGYTGKWHLGTNRTTLYGVRNRPTLPRDVGFEGQNFPGHGGGGFDFPEYKQYLLDHGFEHRVKPWSEATYDFGQAGELEGPTESTVPYFLAEHTISLIERFRRRSQPFFIWHNFWGPHEPYYVPKQWLDPYRNVEIPQWPNYSWPARSLEGPHKLVVHPQQDRLSWEDWATTIRYYYAFVSLIDSQIGRILDHLRAVNLLDNTVVLFTADHGESLGSHGGLVDKGWRHFEETHRIPLIVRFPGRRYAGMTVTQLVSLTDVYPTILEIAGAQGHDHDIHGLSLLPLLCGDVREWRDQVVVEFHGLNEMTYTQRTVRWANYKFGFNCGNRDELYDLGVDPHEMENVAGHAEYKKIVEEGRERLRTWMKETDDPALYLYDRMFHW